MTTNSEHGDAGMEASSGSSPRGSWREMVQWCEDLVLQRTGESAETWAQRAREDGMLEEAPLKEWMRERGIEGYAAGAVQWRVLGYPESFLQDADELLDAQYADRPHLRPMADALLAWAEEQGATVQLRKTYASLMGRRKFAQVAPKTKSAVDVDLRVTPRLGGVVEVIRAHDGGPFDQRIRLRSLDDLTDEVFAALEAARAESA